jgi:hypothetical protein
MTSCLVRSGALFFVIGGGASWAMDRDGAAGVPVVFGRFLLFLFAKKAADVTIADATTPMRAICSFFSENWITISSSTAHVGGCSWRVAGIGVIDIFNFNLMTSFVDLSSCVIRKRRRREQQTQSCDTPRTSRHTREHGGTAVSSSFTADCTVHTNSFHHRRRSSYSLTLFLNQTMPPEAHTRTYDRRRSPRVFQGRQIPEPYREWTHPHKSWIDILVSLVLAWLMPLSKICQYSPKIRDDEEIKEALTSLRQSVAKSSTTGLRAWLDRWRSLNGGGELVETRLYIHRHVKILAEWNLVHEQDPILQELIAREKENDHVEVIMRFPLDLLPPDSSVHNNEKNKTTGCIVMEESELDWKLFPVGVPILLYFHGGGMVSGTADDSLHMNHVRSLLEAQMAKTERDFVPHKIILCVEYRLAPEHPFPASHVDTVSVLEYVLSNTTSDHNINMYGTSAGGLLAASGSLEAHRRYPGRLRR